MITIESDDSDQTGWQCGAFTLSLNARGRLDFDYGAREGIVINQAQMKQLLPALQHYVETGELPKNQ